MSHPSVIAGFMVWLDSTHLTQFGQAKAWPIYAYIGNLSKYVRCQPTAHAAQVIGYILMNSMVLTSGEVTGLSQDSVSKQDAVAGKHRSKCCDELVPQ